MNGMSQLEKRLRSWIPRPPSPEAKRRVWAQGGVPASLPDNRFVPANAGVAALQPAPFRLGWFAPATVSLLLACVVFNHHNSFVLSDSASAGPLVAAALSNQSAAAWLPGSFARSQNSLPVDPFDWTNVSSRDAARGFRRAN